MWWLRVVASLLVIHQTFADESINVPDLFHYDNFDTCMKLKDKALFCYVRYVAQPIDQSTPSDVWRIIQERSNGTTKYKHDHFRHFICVPKTCPKVDVNLGNLEHQLERCYNEKYANIGLVGQVIQINCKTDKPRYEIDWLDIVAGIIFGSYLLFVCYATVYEGVLRYWPDQYSKMAENKNGRLLQAFAIGHNWDRLKTVKSTKEVEQLRCIQGIRVYNTFLVIVSHTILTYLAAPVTNTDYFEALTDNPATLFMGSGPLCVCTFFLIASFLLSNGLFEYMQTKKLNLKTILFMFANRLFRLTPTLAAVILFHMTWWRHLSDGPMWDLFIGNESRNCRKNGWATLFYVNIWFNYSELCMPVTWYLSLDTQYFLLNLLLIWALKTWETKFWKIIAGAISFNIIGAFTMNYIRDYPGLVQPTAELYYLFDYMKNNIQTHNQLCGFINNMAGPIIGTAFGYYYFKTKNVKKDWVHTKFGITLWWLSSLGVSLLLVIIPGNLILDHTRPHNRFWASVYAALSRPVFAFAIGTTIIGFTNGVGWLFLKTVQWGPTYILGRMTFSVYLVHMSLLMMRPALHRAPQYVSDFQIIRASLGDVFLSVLCALAMMLTLELPLSELQKILFEEKPKQK